MRRHRYDVRGGILAPPEVVLPKDRSRITVGTVLVTSDNQEESTDEDDCDLDFLVIKPKIKLSYHWNDPDGTYKLDINYNEKEGFNADLSGPDARKFRIMVAQTGAEPAPGICEKRKLSIDRIRGDASKGPLAFVSVTIDRVSLEDLLSSQDYELDEDFIA
ncbi:hypothetical protein DRE_04826 [Drechslerella stenobrocha 248]|uniref:Uncharacterized protein n=1 Tax=Drechslerella stenobrocha 248 TaxID=1043628 RepID=W7I1E3_9PEZI|nr:hypothetical protein DRE_04826 [Drechslerella stenobrocha 248]